MTKKIKMVIEYIEESTYMPKSFSEQERKIIKQSMIDIGASLMKTKSIKQITVDEITKGANISKGSFYSFYDSREELFWDIIKLEEQQLVDEIINIANQELDTKNKIRQIFNDVFLRKNWLIYYLPESDIQYIARKLPLELLEADRERSYELNKTMLSLCNLDESQENMEFLITTIQMLRLTETNSIHQTEQNKKRVQHILVETIVDYLCGEKSF